MRSILVLATAALFLLAGIAPVTADPGHGPKGGDHGKSGDHGKEAKGEHKGKGTPTNVTLDLSGSGKTKKNATFSLDLEAMGAALEKAKNGTARAYTARLDAQVTVTDGNGTAKTTAVKVKFGLRQGDGGNWTWHLESVAKKAGPRINARGDATSLGDGQFDLTGKAKMVLKPDGKRAMLVKMPELDGAFAKVA